MNKKPIYLDYAAATPVDPKVIEVMRPYWSEKFHNPSALYLGAKSAAKDLDKFRAQVAYWLGARPQEIVFTAGGTEANNMALHGIMRRFPNGNLIISSIEHESVLKTARAYNYKEAPVTTEGILDIASLERLIDDNTTLISIMYANNEVGTIQPIRQTGQLIEMARKSRLESGNSTPLYLHTDAAQAAGYLDLHASRLKADLMTINSGKIYGPKQCGALFVKGGIELAPLILGGGQEKGLRSGTESLASIAGFSTALDLAQKNRHAETAHLKQLQELFFKTIQDKIPSSIINGSLKHRLPNNVHITIPGSDNERLIMQLDERGIQCAAGSACSADSTEPSHVLRAMGISNKNARSSLRFTMGKHTKKSDITKTVEVLASLA